MKLLSILKPPKSPSENSNLNWKEAEKILNFIPHDYKKFIEAYGSGSIDGYMSIINPFSKNSYLNFNASIEIIETYFEFRDMFPELECRPRFPQNYSFFPWAITGNGDSLFWIVDRTSNDWNTGVHNHDQTEEEIYNFNMSTLLYKILNKEIISDILAPDWPPNSHEFKSY